MKIRTSRFGEIEVNEQDLINLPKGLIGFPELNQFTVLEHEKNSPFKWLQSVAEPQIAFVIMNPHTFRQDYIVEVNEEDATTLELTNADNADVFAIVTIPSEPKNMSANLYAPLVFNKDKKIAKQIVLLEHKNYRTKHFILEEIKRSKIEGN